MKGKIRYCALLASSFMAIEPQAQAVQLLVNPGFELPAIISNNCGGGPAASCETFFIGDSIGGWTAVGPGGARAPVIGLTSAFTDNGADHYTAEEGNQSLDLTGLANQGANGVEQTVTTTPGFGYGLSFFVGNEDNSLPNYALNSSIELLINGVNEGIFTSTGNVFHDVSWAGFTFDFIASAASTTIDFINATPVSDGYAGLDNVALTSADVPPVDLSEPGTCGPMVVGVGLMLAARRRTGPKVVASA